MYLPFKQCDSNNKLHDFIKLTYSKKNDAYIKYKRLHKTHTF